MIVIPQYQISVYLLVDSIAPQVPVIEAFENMKPPHMSSTNASTSREYGAYIRDTSFKSRSEAARNSG